MYRPETYLSFNYDDYSQTYPKMSEQSNFETNIKQLHQVLQKEISNDKQTSSKERANKLHKQSTESATSSSLPSHKLSTTLSSRPNSPPRSIQRLKKHSWFVMQDSSVDENEKVYSVPRKNSSQQKYLQGANKYLIYKNSINNSNYQHKISKINVTNEKKLVNILILNFFD